MSEQNSAPKPKRRDRREEILREATHLFAEHGYQGATLSMIAEAVGLTEPGVLHYFPSKVHLLQGVLAYRDEKEAEKYAGMLAAQKRDIAELLGLLEEVYRENEKVPGIIQLFTVLVGESIYPEHPSHDFFVDRYRRERAIYTEQLSMLTDQTIPPGVSTGALATLIMAVMDGLHIQWLLDPDRVDLVATYQLFAQMVIEYLGE
ncbi:MAG: TetR/AcrR family transcriptional regulator [Chloroflexi bacterium]|nr:TetR/AcrR family transcriptional regulator [Chloroflexota bacterium]